MVTEAVQHDYDVSIIGFRKGEIPYTGLVAFPADPALREEAVKAIRETAPEIKVFEGRVCSGDQFIASSEQKQQILDNFGGLCCEMEGAAIAQRCYLLTPTPLHMTLLRSGKPMEQSTLESLHLDSRMDQFR